MRLSFLAYAALAICAVVAVAFAIAAFTKPVRLAGLEPLPAVRWEFPGENR